jgi:hypothetical protein
MPKKEALPRYVAILDWLLDQGARVDARDIGGYTALGHAAAHTPVLPLAEVLLQRGSNVNYQNRFGAPVLVSAVMASEVPPFGMPKCITTCCTSVRHLHDLTALVC